MNQVIYYELEFWVLILFSLILPAGIFGWLIWKHKPSRLSVSAVAALLVVLAGADAILLQRLGAKAKASASSLDDRIFASELSIAAYILPLILAGIGVNLISNILHDHIFNKKGDNPK